MTVQGVYAEDVARWESELRAAGWVEEPLSVWKSQGGVRRYGPGRAWEQMKRDSVFKDSQSDASVVTKP
jgi:hypothetical protein